MSLTREQILASRRDRKPVRLEVPEWGGDVFVRVLSAGEQAALADGIPQGELPVRVLLYALTDEDGARIFADDDFDALQGEAFPIILRVFTEAAKLNGLSTSELEAAMADFATAPDASGSSG